MQAAHNVKLILINTLLFQRELQAQQQLRIRVIWEVISQEFSFNRIDDNEKCHSHCNYATYGMYKDTVGQASVCKTCNSNCIQCTSNSNCNECLYTKQRIQGAANINNFLTLSAAGTLSCSSGISTH